MTDEELAQLKQDGEYLAVRRLEDGTIAAIGDLVFTRAVYLGCDRWGWKRRFCFEARAWANREFELLKTQLDEPEGYIARRP